MNPSGSDSFYAAIIYGSSTLSLLTNSILLALYMRCPLKTIKTYKHFFAMTALNDMVASTIMLLCVPRVYHSIDYYINAATGLIQQWQAGVALLFLYWFTLYSSFLILTNSFVYRYIYVCRPDLSHLFTSKMWILIICIANVFLLSDTAFLMLMTSLPNAAFRVQIENAGMEGIAFVGVSSKHSINQISKFLAVEISSVLLCSLVEFFCAIRIHLTLRSSGISSCVKRLQKQMFRVLLLQTTCSTMFVHFPAVVIYVTYLGNFDSIPLATDCICVLHSLYPLINSIVTMFSIADYRIYLISLFSNCIVSHFTRCVGPRGSDAVTPSSQCLSYVAPLNTLSIVD